MFKFIIFSSFKFGQYCAIFSLSLQVWGDLLDLRGGEAKGRGREGGREGGWLVTKERKMEGLVCSEVRTGEGGRRVKE